MNLTNWQVISAISRTIDRIETTIEEEEKDENKSKGKCFCHVVFLFSKVRRKIKQEKRWNFNELFIQLIMMISCVLSSLIIILPHFLYPPSFILYFLDESIFFSILVSIFNMFFLSEKYIRLPLLLLLPYNHPSPTFHLLRNRLCYFFFIEIWLVHFFI